MVEWLIYCMLRRTPIQENFIYKKQGPSPISLVRAARIFSKAKTLKKKFDLSLAIRDNPIYPFEIARTGPDKSEILLGI